MSVFGILHKHKRQFGSGLICRVFVALFLLAFVGVFVVSLALNAQADNEPVQSIELSSGHLSYENGDPGAWNITKMAGWTGLGTAKIVFNVDTLTKLPDKDSDIILVVNRNSSNDDNFGAAVSALNALVNRFLDDGDNRISLVTFGHAYNIVTDFTDDRELLLEKISLIGSESETNYYQGLNGAERVLRNYVHDENRNAIVVFLTNSAATEEVLYQFSEYRLIKALYPYVIINAVQYELGEEITGSLTRITDNYYIADKNNIGDELFNASVAPYYYDNFVVTDYLDSDNFTISGVDAIDASLGSVALDYENGVPKITWDLSNVLRTGFSAEMTIDVNLKPGLVTTPGVYSTNSSTTITSSLPVTTVETVSTNTTPILKTDYVITYDANEPGNCTASDVPADEIHYVYETIPFSNVKPTCNGYIFKGWKIAEEHIAYVNNDYFIMPDTNIRVVATWGKPSISKSMDGTVKTIQTLYGAIAKKSKGANNSYNLDTDVNFTVIPSVVNGLGVNTVASTADDEYPVHYFRGDVSDNNVLFAGMCWKAMRTTSTGGVKLVYNGEASNGSCDSSRGTHIGYGTATTKKLSSYYYYGTDFVYDQTTNTFALSGIKTFEKWSDATSDSLIDKYTCASADQNATCSTMYFVSSRSSNDYAYVMPMSTSIKYYSVAKTQFNINGDSASSAGYMYGHYSKQVYISMTSYISSNSAVLFPSTSLSTSFWYADSVSYGNDVSGQYSLVNPYQIQSSSDYSSLVGKYTFRNSSNGYHNSVVYYIAAVYSGYMYYIQLDDGQLTPGTEEYYVVGDNYIDHGDGTYTLTNTFTIRKADWASRHGEANGKYICGEIGSATCGEPRYITSTDVHLYRFIPVTTVIKIAKSHDGLTLQDVITVRLYEVMRDPSSYSEYRFTCQNMNSVCADNKLYFISSYTSERMNFYLNVILGSSVSWNGSYYTLVDTVDDISNNASQIATHHFACPTLGQTTCEQAIYLYGYSGHYEFGSASYAILENGMTTPQEILDRIFENKYNSNVKSAVDAWYARTLTGYTYMIEDVPYCNDRYNPGTSAWNPNVSLSNYSLHYGNHSISSAPSLGCENDNDAFTVDPAKGNGALKYPVGLPTADEIVMAGHGFDTYGNQFQNSKSYLQNSSETWTITPRDSSTYTTNVYFWSTKTSAGYLNTNSFDTRPVISIKPGVYIDTGSGTEDDPWTLVE